MEECEELCDTICIIKDGIIAKDSTPASLISELGNYFQVTLSVAADGDAKTNIAKIEELMRTLSPNLTVKDLLVCLLHPTFRRRERSAFSYRRAWRLRGFSAPLELKRFFGPTDCPWQGTTMKFKLQSDETDAAKVFAALEGNKAACAPCPALFARLSHPDLLSHARSETLLRARPRCCCRAVGIVDWAAQTASLEDVFLDVYGWSKEEAKAE